MPRVVAWCRPLARGGDARRIDAGGCRQPRMPVWARRVLVDVGDERLTAERLKTRTSPASGLQALLPSSFVR